MTGLALSSVAVTSASAEQHKVQSGENLWDIANEYNTTVDKLVQINDLKTTVIQPKQIIYIDNTYIVQQGDTLLSIAKEYQVSLEELKEWNDLDSELIVIGQKLEIEGVAVDQTNEAPEVKEEPVAKKEEAKATQPAPEQKTSSNADSSNPTKEQKPQGKTISVTSTAYTASCDGCSGVTYTGIDLNKDPNAKVIAVDPNVIPLGTKVHVEGYGYAIAADIGGAIKGNKIDVHVPSKDEAANWGVRTVNVTIVE